MVGHKRKILAKLIDEDHVEIDGVIYKKEYQQDREFMEYKLKNERNK